MAMEPPPSRYRVVERGRRLEVIDTLAERRAVYAPEASASRSPAPDILANTASLFASERDGDGRLLLNTAR